MKIIGRPISKKNSRRIFRRGERIINLPSEAFEIFEEDTLWQLKKYSEKHKGAVVVNFTFQVKGKMTSDLDNMITSILDILEKAEIIDNDKNVVGVNAIKCGGFKDWVTIIEIKRAQSIVS